jgi:hypothetical protein
MGIALWAHGAAAGIVAAAEHRACTTHIIVDRADDTSDGTCVANRHSRGQCNLRAAAQAALVATGPVEIELAVDATIERGQIALAVADGAPAARIAVVAHHPRKITGNQTSRLFDIGANVDVELRNLVISSFFAFDGGAVNIAANGRLEASGVTFAHNAAGCSGVGAMTAYATCSGGAIQNGGTLVLNGGTRFEDNSLRAEAYTASFTTAWGAGGAIASGGSIVIDGPVHFTGNSSTALSVSGVHPLPVSGAWATAFGGAIFSSGGSLRVEGRAIGRCHFEGNVATAQATSIDHQTESASSIGGAIYAQGELDLPTGACTFQDNAALTDADLHSEQ